MQDTRWDHALKVTGGGTGLVGHAGAVLLRKAADQGGLSAALSAARLLESILTARLRGDRAARDTPGAGPATGDARGAALPFG